MYEEKYKKSTLTLNRLYQEMDFLDEENDKKDVQI